MVTFPSAPQHLGQLWPLLRETQTYPFLHPTVLWQALGPRTETKNFLCLTMGVVKKYKSKMSESKQLLYLMKHVYCQTPAKRCPTPDSSVWRVQMISVFSRLVLLIYYLHCVSKSMFFMWDSQILKKRGVSLPALKWKQWVKVFCWYFILRSYHGWVLSIVLHNWKRKMLLLTIIKR